MPCTISKREIRKSFSRASSTYDKLSHVQAVVNRMLIEDIPNRCFRHVLEIGCGTGAFTSGLVSERRPGQVLAVDLSHEMLSVASARLNRFGNICLACCDAEEMPVKHAPHFDLIVSSSSLQWFSRLDESVSRLIAENLETGGWFHAAMFGRNTLRELSRVISISRPEAKQVIPAASFPESEQDIALARGLLTDFKFKKSIIKRQYSDLFDLLKVLKGTGVSPGGNKQPIFTSKGAIDAAQEIYLSEFGAITASYEIILVSGRKKDNRHSRGGYNAT